MTGVRWIALWDDRHWPGRMIAGLPAFEFGCAPTGLATRRQLRATSLCPGGQEPFARLIWRGGRRWAWLFIEDRARPKRAASPAQLAAVSKALAARRVCVVCGPVAYCVRTTDRLCGECHAAGVEPVTCGIAAWDGSRDWVSWTGRLRGVA